MSETQPTDDELDASGLMRQNVRPTAMTAWVGWVAFAGIMMMLLGAFHVIDGLVALFQNQYFKVGRSGLTVHVDYTIWGWVHMVAGASIVAAGVGVLTGKTWARVVAVFLAVLSALVNLGFLAAYPIWATIMIALDIVVIWALTVHGEEIRGD